MAAMKHPIVIALGAGLAVLLVAFLFPLLHMGRGAPPAPAATEQQLPWQAEARPDGTLAVFGLALGRDTLADAQARFGDNLQTALVARLGEAGVLEALVDPFSAGFVSGRLVLSFDVPASTLLRWREQSSKSEPMEGGVRRFGLPADALPEARAARIAGLSFVPAVKLGEADVRQRFGAPAQTVEQSDGSRVLLYPERGLSVAVAASATSRGVLQYVAPRDFESRLRAPLAASAVAR